MTRVSYDGVTTGDTDVEVDLTVEGADEDVVEKVAMHARDQAVRAIQAFDTGKPPEECDGTFVSVNWESVLGDVLAEASDGGVSISTAIKAAIDDHETANGAPIDDVVDTVAEEFDREDVEDALESLKKRGEVYKPNDDALRVT